MGARRVHFAPGTRAGSPLQDAGSVQVLLLLTGSAPAWEFDLQDAISVTSPRYTLWQLAAYMLRLGTLGFGGPVALVGSMHRDLVEQRGWITDRQFVAAVAVAMITPGPVVITTGFIGYLVSGFWGACVAAAATFLPCYLLTVIPAPYFKKHGRHPGVVAFVDGVTAAAIGARRASLNGGAT